MRSASARDDKICQNIERTRAIHNEKLNKSNANFKNTRVTSCSGVLMKNGKAVAMCFNQPPKCYKKEGDPLKSSETTSIAADMFKMRSNLHAGMARKPLGAYHPNAPRSRLPQPTIVMPYKNSSQIVIGDRSSYYKRQFVTTSANTFSGKAAPITSNPGIVSEVCRQ